MTEPTLHHRDGNLLILRIQNLAAMGGRRLRVRDRAAARSQRKGRRRNRREVRAAGEAPHRARPMTGEDPIVAQFRDYKPDPALQHRDRGAMALESKVATLRRKGADVREISIKLKMPEAAVERVLAFLAARR